MWAAIIACDVYRVEFEMWIPSKILQISYISYNHKKNVSGMDTAPHHQHDQRASSDVMLQYSNQVGMLTKMLMEQQLKTTLPQRNKKAFSGDPLDYNAFMQAFRYGVESKTQSYADRLYYLEQYTVDELNRLVRSCMNRDPRTGYGQAIELLAKNFGNKHQIVEAYLTKIKQNPKIKANDDVNLQKYSLLLFEAQNALEGVSYSQEMNN